MPELKADLLPRLSIQVAVSAMAVAAVDGGGVARINIAELRRAECGFYQVV